MEVRKYPVGIQSFPKLRENGYIYVDKTALIASLVSEHGHYFLSRPRRFGKSLLLSTIHAYFAGDRELFRDLAIDGLDIEWEKFPVLHFDLNSANYAEEDALESLLDAILRNYEAEYGCEAGNLAVSQRFGNVIRSARRQKGRSVVILVDEYDKPLLGNENNPRLFEKNQEVLKGFFGNLKSEDGNIRFSMLTGVARFNKVSVFSDLNNLDDISLTAAYNEICGITEAELKEYFSFGIGQLAADRGETPAQTIEELRTYYDGYLFSRQGNRLYNPFSLLMALRNREIEPYWFETGTPTFLARRVKESGINLERLNGIVADREKLTSVGLGSEDMTGLMFQTGYLTIDHYEKERQRYVLRFPNREVEIGFARNLLRLYAPETAVTDSRFSFSNFQDDLYEGRPDRFMERLGTMMKNMPYEHHGEWAYQNLVYLLCTLVGSNVNLERHSYLGRSDLEVSTPRFNYIFEFKFNGRPEEALAQIKERDYAGRLAFEGKKTFLIGANFSDKKPHRGLAGYIIEEI